MLTAKKILVFSAENKLQLLSEMLPSQVSLMTILKLILMKKEIQNRKNNRKRKVFLVLIPSIFMKKFMEKLQKKHLSLNLLQLLREEEEEGEGQLQELVLT